jgi:hypothetical protein
MRQTLWQPVTDVQHLDAYRHSMKAIVRGNTHRLGAGCCNPAIVTCIDDHSTLQRPVV